MNTTGALKEKLYLRLANYIIIVCILLYGGILSAQCLFNGECRIALSKAGFTLSAAVLSTFVIFKTKKPGKLAFRIPAIASLCFLISSAINGGSLYFFLTVICLHCLSGMYFNYKYYIRFLIFINSITAVLLFVFRAQVMGPEVSIADTYIAWLVMFVGIILFTIITRYSVSRNIQSVKARDSFHAMLKLTPNFVAIVDDKNRATYISKALSALSRIERPEMSAGRPLIDLFHDSEMKVMISEILDSKGFYEATLEIHRDGETFYYRVITDEMKGETKGRFIDISDVTSLVKAKIEAEHATHAKSIFLARMSHEIRTPMNAITGMAELALRENISPAAHEQILTIRQAGMNLVSIINDILDFSKIESGKFELLSGEYYFSSLLNDVIGIIRVKSVDKNLLFTVDVDCNIPGVMIGDEIRIRQILLNILGNAIKYTDTGFVSLRISGEIKEDDTVVLVMEIQDSGKGIRQEDIAKLFDEFVQLDINNNKGITGSGLGLAITWSFIKAMGGDVSVSSDYGKGSTFTVTLPQKFKEYKKLAFVENPGSKSVLVYEKRRIYADSIVGAVRNLGAPCSHVSDEEAFYEKLSDNQFGFIFISLELYEENKKLISALESETEVVLLTDYGSSHDGKELRTVSMPVYSAVAANVLNGSSESFTYNKTRRTKIQFSAPEARILLVDDVLTNLKVAEGLMRPYNMQITSCLNGPDAIAAAKSTYFDIIFMDHMMPDMDGIEAAARIRELDDYRSSPIIALTANAVSGMKEMYLQNGFTDYLDKPIDFMKLDSILGRWVPKAKQIKSEHIAKTAEISAFEIKNVDVNSGIMMTGGTSDGYLRILDSFYKDGLNKISELKSNLESGDLSLYTINIHSMKGSAATIGAQKLSEMAKALEVAGDTEDYDYISEHNGVFLAELECLLEDIRALLNSKAGDNKNFAPEETVRMTLVKLKKALNETDIETIDAYAESLGNLKTKRAVASILESVSHNILMGEYETAVKLIDQILTEWSILTGSAE